MRHFIVRAGKRPVELLEDLREHRGLFLALLLAKPTSGSQGAQNNPHPRGMLFFERRMGRRQFTKLLWKAISVQAPSGAGVLDVSGKLAALRWVRGSEWAPATTRLTRTG
jgi:hypothetical protein